MKFYLAPMEGITGFVYRNAYEKIFGGVDKYFTPFIVPNESRSLKTREFRDVLPENNLALNIVPQILTNNSEGFIHTANKLKELGYNEVNLNLGCPASTVVTKRRGAGLLEYKDDLDRILNDIYSMNNMKISIKTRIGKSSPEEFYELLEIYNKYPLEELIIHPRTREDFYGNTPNLEIFKHAVDNSNTEICYNGDIVDVDSYNKLSLQFPMVNEIMIGRGILINPALIREIKGGTPLTKEELKQLHDEVFNSYIEIFGEEKNAMYRMKELWGYMSQNFNDGQKYLKKIKKAQKTSDYKAVVSSLIREVN